MFGLEGAGLSAAILYGLTGALLVFASHGPTSAFKQGAALGSLVTVSLAVSFMFQSYLGEPELEFSGAGVIERRVVRDRGGFQFRDVEDSGSATSSRGKRGAIWADTDSSSNSTAGEGSAAAQGTDGGAPVACDICPDVTVIRPGYFSMGAAPDDADAAANEMPSRLVRIARPYAISRGEVTIGQYMAFVRATGQRPPACGDTPIALRDARLPVTCVSWREAHAYAGWLSTETDRVWRLPTEPEWEFAARANSSQRYASGAYLAAKTANIAMRDGAPEPINARPANDFGLYGIHGNVAELTSGCWQDGPAGYLGDGTQKRSGDCKRRALRDAAWFETTLQARVSARRPVASDERGIGVGFRVVLEK